MYMMRVIINILSFLNLNFTYLYVPTALSITSMACCTLLKRSLFEMPSMFVHNSGGIVQYIQHLLMMVYSMVPNQWQVHMQRR